MRGRRRRRGGGRGGGGLGLGLGRAFFCTGELYKIFCVCKLGGVFWGSPLLCSCGGGSFRSGVQPPTGSRADRHSSTRAFKFGKALPQSIFQTAFCHLLLCFRVGGSFRSGVQPPTGSRVGGGRFSALAWVDRSGRGFNPRPALGGRPLPCSCVGGSFRSGVQPPTGSRSDRHSPTRTPRPA